MAWEDWVDRFAIWDGVHPDLQTLLLYGVGIALYTMLVFSFYKRLSCRLPSLFAARRGVWGRVLRGTEDVLVFPVMSFLYFAVLALSLFLLAKSQQTAQILLLSMSVVLGVRVTAFLSEEASLDLAKLLPLSLLGVLIVDPGYLTLSTTLTRLAEALTMVPVLLQYFVLFILVEAVLRGVRALLPTLARLRARVHHKRTLSKRAMLRDIVHEHEKSHFHEHGPREKAPIVLDERTGPKRLRS